MNRYTIQKKQGNGAFEDVTVPGHSRVFNYLNDANETMEMLVKKLSVDKSWHYRVVRHQTDGSVTVLCEEKNEFPDEE